MAKSLSLFTWTDDEVELLLKITNEYKTVEDVGWESVQRRYSDILDCFRDVMWWHMRALNFVQDSTF